MTDALLCPQGVATWPDEPADVVRIVRPEGARRRRRPRAPAGADPRSTPDCKGRGRRRPELPPYSPPGVPQARPSRAADDAARYATSRSTRRRARR